MRINGLTVRKGLTTLLAIAGFSIASPQMAIAGNFLPLPETKPPGVDGVKVSQHSDVMPVPGYKPDFGRPHVMQLLQFGTPPVPKAKPVTDSKKPISNENAALYKKIFLYQSLGQWDKADEYINKLTDMRLRGHVLYQRYMHPTKYTSTFEELVGWLDMYNDHPDADKVYKLSLARMPSYFKGTIKKPVARKMTSGFLPELSDKNRIYASSNKRSVTEKSNIDALKKAIYKDVTRGAPTNAYKLLLSSSEAKLLDTVEYSELLAEIASSYMIEGKLDKSLDLARTSAKQADTQVPLSGWVAGLVSWRKKEYANAARYFEIPAKSEYSSTWMASAGAYWASRAHMRSGNIREVSYWLELAAQNPRTFYGLIATRALGWDFDFNWTVPALTEEHKKDILQHPSGRRASALAAVGQYYLAENELRLINTNNDTDIMETLLAYADDIGLPSFSLRLAESMSAPDGKLYDAGLYPLCPWRPKGGYKIDRALIHALMRQESRFNPQAENRSGATGLMQLMPATASYVSGKKIYKNASARHTLKDPQVNLDIGQTYIENLMRQDVIQEELFSLIIAYNAGPGNLKKWKRELSDVVSDPLLFVETIPMGETRAFVERVMANYWIYRQRLGQPTPSLDSVAEGKWARYVRLDDSIQPVKKANSTIISDTNVASLR